MDDQPTTAALDPATAILALARHIEAGTVSLLGTAGQGGLVPLAIAFALGRAMARAGASPRLEATLLDAVRLGAMQAERERSTTNYFTTEPTP